MKKQFTPIAMICSQKQFDEIKPKLKGLDIISINCFDDFRYLTNDFGIGDKILISNISNTPLNNERIIYETWDERVFLEACGIQNKPINNIKMKKVILKERIEEVYLSDLNDDSIVGIVFENDSKGVLIYTPEGFCSTSDLNIYNKWFRDTKKQYLKDLEHKETYQFDTMKDLYKWLGEE